MSNYESVLANARSLAVEDRLQWIEDLSESCSAESLPAISSEWIVEIERRSNEYDDGSIATVPWERIRAEAFERLGIPVNVAR